MHECADYDSLGKESWKMHIHYQNQHDPTNSWFFPSTYEIERIALLSLPLALSYTQ